MIQAMPFAGVDAVDGSPRRWRVENGYGDQEAKTCPTTNLLTLPNI